MRSTTSWISRADSVFHTQCVDRVLRMCPHGAYVYCVMVKPPASPKVVSPLSLRPRDLIYRASLDDQAGYSKQRGASAFEQAAPNPRHITYHDAIMAPSYDSQSLASDLGRNTTQFEKQNQSSPMCVSFRYRPSSYIRCSPNMLDLIDMMT